MQPSGSDFRLLQVFDAVVRNGGFSAAEAELNLSQSTISNHMTALEQRLGVVLCRRGRGGFRLTDEGRAIHEAATRLDAALRDFSSEVGSVLGQLRGELRIGTLDSIADDPGNRLHQALGLFRRAAGAVGVVLAQEAAQELQQKVLEGVYHCGIGVDLTPVHGLDQLPLHTEKHSLYCGVGHPLFGAADDMVCRDAVLDLAFVQRGYWRQGSKPHSRFRNVAATVYQIEPQLLLIRSGAYVGYLPDQYAKRWVDADQLKRLAPETFGYEAQFYLFTARNSRKSNIVSAFRAAVLQAWKINTAL